MRLPNTNRIGEGVERAFLQPNSVKAVLVGLCSAALAFAWLSLATHYLYAGNWTSVYYTGARMPVPEALAQEHIYQFPNVTGYDGQAYHLVAHDPLFHRGLARVMDMPRVRYRRILVPALTSLLSFGQANWVDPAFILVVLGFVYLGAFWLASWSISHERSVLWGFLFLAAPAALASVLMMVIDVSLAALTVGFIWYAERKSNAKLFIVLMCAALARETGMLVVAGYCIWLLLQRRFGRAAVFALAATPAILWGIFVQFHTSPVGPAWISPIPFLGIYPSFVNASMYSVGMTRYALLALDRLALVGMILAIGFALYNALHPELHTAATFVALAFALLGIFLAGGDVWQEVLGFGRNFTPLLLIVAMYGIVRRNWWAVLPVLLVSLRISAIYVNHAGRIIGVAMHHI